MTNLTCPYCGGVASYIGFSSVECTSSSCKFFVGNAGTCRSVKDLTSIYVESANCWYSDVGIRFTVKEPQLNVELTSNVGMSCFDTACLANRVDPSLPKSISRWYSYSIDALGGILPATDPDLDKVLDKIRNHSFEGLTFRLQLAALIARSIDVTVGFIYKNEIIQHTHILDSNGTVLEIVGI